jgi:hypothetical protein
MVVSPAEIVEYDRDQIRGLLQGEAARQAQIGLRLHDLAEAYAEYRMLSDELKRSCSFSSTLKSLLRDMRSAMGEE